MGRGGPHHTHTPWPSRCFTTNPSMKAPACHSYRATGMARRGTAHRLRQLQQRHLKAMPNAPAGRTTLCPCGGGRRGVSPKGQRDPTRSSSRRLPHTVLPIQRRRSEPILRAHLQTRPSALTQTGTTGTPVGTVLRMGKLGSLTTQARLWSLWKGQILLGMGPTRLVTLHCLFSVGTFISSALCLGRFSHWPCPLKARSPTAPHPRLAPHENLVCTQGPESPCALSLTEGVGRGLASPHPIPPTIGVQLLSGTLEGGRETN